MNETILKILIGAGAVIVLVVALVLAKEHYIQVGRDEVTNQIKLVAQAEAARLALAESTALKDAANRVAAIRDSEKAMSGALNSSEVLNHAEGDSPCLSDSRRMRINTIR